MRDKFRAEAIFEGNDKWEKSIKRNNLIYGRSNDIRSEFTRDYNRILHSNAYGRLKHKTQVFFDTHNDHVCTRIEHVGHVASVSYSIAKYLGLNTELTNAIALGHDIGHAPFGHEGEKILNEYKFKNGIVFSFWHEKNSLYFADEIETLPDNNDNECNLNLTYAVRDGIVCHCGEVNQNKIFPRNEEIDLNIINEPGKIQPYTWEGCIVKIADKISYLGRDIEDAIRLNILNKVQQVKLWSICKKVLDNDVEVINNTVLMHDFMIDLCNNSDPNEGIYLSDKYLNLMQEVVNFNYKYIYQSYRVENFKKYARLILETIIGTLENNYEGNKTLDKLEELQKRYPNLYETFYSWLIKYSFNYDNSEKHEEKSKRFKNKKIYDLNKESDYYRAIIDYVSGMTDMFSIRIFNEIMQL